MHNRIGKRECGGRMKRKKQRGWIMRRRDEEWNRGVKWRKEIVEGTGW